MVQSLLRRTCGAMWRDKHQRTGADSQMLSDGAQQLLHHFLQDWLQSSEQVASGRLCGALLQPALKKPCSMLWQRPEKASQLDV